ncbi:MAG TPA: ATP--guanido phosphotransferase [Spirochaetia bacterium]|nr:ATP--guanido phosphotransferase [Spirochaetia bacterium]
MIEFTGVAETRGWFTEPGPENDVVLASRVRLSRNLDRHHFPGMMKSDEEELVQTQILKAIGSLGERYESTVLGQLSPLERRLMLERNLISQDFSLHSHKAVFLRSDEQLAGMVNEIDHIRFASLCGGLNLRRAREEVDSVDDVFEEQLDYAASLNMGYLNTEISNAGTGMRASIMLHLPSLVATSLVEKTFKAVVQLGLSVKGFFGDDENSLGCMYQVSNQFGLGFTEEEIIEKLESVATQIVNYERKARDEMVGRQRVDLEDRVYRAFGLLKYCRSISAREAIENLSSLRLGAALGWVDMPVELITALFFLTQKSHVQQLIDSGETGADTKLIDHTRAVMIKEALGNVEL